MKYCHLFVPTDLNEINLEINSRKVNASFGRIHGNSSKLMTRFWPMLLMFKTNILVQTLMYQRNMSLIERVMDQNLAHSGWKIIQF